MKRLTLTALTLVSCATVNAYDPYPVANQQMQLMWKLSQGMPTDTFHTVSEDFILIDDIYSTKLIYSNAGSLIPKYHGVNVDVGTYRGQQVIFAGKHPLSGQNGLDNYIVPVSAIQPGDNSNLEQYKYPTNAFCAINGQRSVTGELEISDSENCEGSYPNSVVTTQYGCVKHNLPGHVSSVLICDTSVWLYTESGATVYSHSYDSSGFKPRVNGIADYDRDGQDDIWVGFPANRLSCLLLTAATRSNADGIVRPLPCHTIASIPDEYFIDSYHMVAGFSLYAADYDSDGLPDYTMGSGHAFKGRGMLTVFPGNMVNQGGVIQASDPGVIRIGSNLPNGWFTPIWYSAARDVVGDSTADIVVGRDTDMEGGGASPGAVFIINGRSLLLGE